MNIYTFINKDKLYSQMYEIYKLMEHPLFIKRWKKIIKIFSLLSKGMSSGKYERIMKLTMHPRTTYKLIRQSIDLEKSFRYSDAETKYMIKHEPITPQKDIDKKLLLVPKNNGDFKRINGLNAKMQIETLINNDVEKYYTDKLGEKVYNDIKKE